MIIGDYFTKQSLGVVFKSVYVIKERKNKAKEVLQIRGRLWSWENELSHSVLDCVLDKTLEEAGEIQTTSVVYLRECSCQVVNFDSCTMVMWDANFRRIWIQCKQTLNVLIRVRLAVFWLYKGTEAVCIQ